MKLQHINFCGSVDAVAYFKNQSELTQTARKLRASDCRETPVLSQAKLGYLDSLSRGKFPRLIFSCPVPSGLPHRSHCVPMNMNR